MKLPVPAKILETHCVTLGKTGAGKSSALRVLVEYLLRHKKRVCVIDPKGDWWGLKSSADGAGAGFSVIAFGDFKDARAQDVPINETSGKHVGELITGGNRPCIIGFRGWPTQRMVKFWIDFASTIFAANSGELYLVGDEFHNFAPKGKIQDPQAGMCLHWSNRLLSEGRGLGLICLIASQRPQKVHNDTLTCCETLIAMRVVHKADRDAVKDWIDGCGDMEKGKAILAQLAGMQRGEAFVWSPEAEFGPERITFPMFETFDSFAPPQVQKKTSERDWASVDLDAVKEKLSVVIQEHKANDPAELKRTIATLRREKAELEKRPAARPAAAATETKIKEVPALKDSQISKLVKHYERMISEAERHGAAMSLLWQHQSEEAKALLAVLKTLSAKEKPLLQAVRSLAAPPVPAPRPPRPVQAVQDNGELGKAPRAILTAAIQRNPNPSTRAQLAILSGYSITSSSFSNALGELRSKNFIVGTGDNIRPTLEGIEKLPGVPPLPTGLELQNFWLRQLGKAERAILQAVIEHGPLDKETLSQQSGYSVTSSSFSNAIGKLRTLELVEREWPLTMSPDLIPF